MAAWKFFDALLCNILNADGDVGSSIPIRYFCLAFGVINFRNASSPFLSLRQQQGFSIIGGDMKAGTVEGKFTTKSHTGVMIPVFAYGPGAEEFSGIYENTAIFHKMMAAFKFKTK